jgi:uncharacterized protein YdcH (DUF465 family)
MTNNVLRQEVLDGDKAIFKVVNKKGEFIRYEIFNYWNMIDLLIESNGERLYDLASLYLKQKLDLGDEIYEIVCGVFE